MRIPLRAAERPARFKKDQPWGDWLVFATTIAGLLILLMVPLVARYRAERYHDRIERGIVPARDHIVRTLEAAREARFMAVSEYLFPAASPRTATGTRERYDILVQEFTRLAGDDDGIRAAGESALAMWRSGIRELSAWLEKEGPRSFDRPSRPTGAEYLQANLLFQRGTEHLVQARNETERQQALLQDLIVSINDKEVLIIAPLTVICLVLAALAWRNLASIRRTEARLQTAIKETNHRVKNNLQVVGALIDMQKFNATDPAASAALGDIAQQVLAMASVHELLSNAPDGAIVQSDDLLKRVAEVVGRSARVAVSVDASHSPLVTGQATALALITNELILNSGKHGASRASVRLRSDGSTGTLEVRDNGPGFSPDFDPDRHANLGLSLVTTLVRHDLAGTASFRSDRGAFVGITFPISRA